MNNEWVELKTFRAITVGDVGYTVHSGFPVHIIYWRLVYGSPKQVLINNTNVADSYVCVTLTFRC